MLEIKSIIKKMSKISLRDLLKKTGSGFGFRRSLLIQIFHGKKTIGFPLPLNAFKKCVSRYHHLS